MSSNACVRDRLKGVGEYSCPARGAPYRYREAAACRSQATETESVYYASNSRRVWTKYALSSAQHRTIVHAFLAINLGDKSWRDGIDEKCNFFSQNSLFNSLLLARKLFFLRKIRADAQILLTKLLISDNSANFRAGNEENNF